MMNKYLIRLDDACPHMSLVKWAQMENILDKFEIIGIYDEMTLDSPKSDSERIYFVCKKGDN